ncbi:helix-turn-helix domain-containing protein [Flavobacterium pectinovorum]|jgi:transcriptional regulator with XRE-family HTH domain|nr:helix-turn-helix transcriptional regulator [Flavobacterium pectinovorum]
MKVVIEKIKAIRKEKGYSHEYIAYQLNIGQVAYSKIEKGETKLTLERLIRIAEILETSVGTLLGIDTKTANQLELQQSLHQTNKEKFALIELLYKERLKEKDRIIEQMERTISKLL